MWVDLDLPALGVPTNGLADLAYHAASQTFFGVAHGGATGQPGTLVAIDVSQVALGGDAIFSTQTILCTNVDGVTKSGLPSVAFGTIEDGEGNVYIGANNTDHDLDGATPNAGGFYEITPWPDERPRSRQRSRRSRKSPSSRRQWPTGASRSACWAKPAR